MRKYKAPAKINLYLKVVGKREDGFHELLMLMEKIPLYDFLYVEKTNYGISVDCDIIRSDDNIITRAAQLYLDYFNLKGGFSCKLEKNIPLGAGLGGGSSDAATVLCALRDLYGFGSDQELLVLAAELGSDVPFFIKGKSCIVRGRGEILEEIKPRALGWILLVKPALSLSTADVYEGLDLAELKDHNFEDFYRAYRLEENFMELSVNDLERSAFLLAPQLKKLKEIMGKGALMSGSGSTIFKICKSRKEAEDIKKRLPGNLWVRVLKG